MERPDISIEELREWLHYDPAIGYFTWAVSPTPRIRVGDRAGCSRPDGYFVVRVLKKLYTAHRLAWFYVHGKWPSELIDHRDGNPGNNRLDNLREATNSQNCQNLHRAHKGTASGLLGVHRHKKAWMAQIAVDGKRHQLGSFATPELAHAAYMQAKARLHVGA